MARERSGAGGERARKNGKESVINAAEGEELSCKALASLDLLYL